MTTQMQNEKKKKNEKKSKISLHFSVWFLKVLFKREEKKRMKIFIDEKK